MSDPITLSSLARTPIAYSCLSLLPYVKNTSAQKMPNANIGARIRLIL